MWAIIHVLVRPSRRPRQSDFLGQRSISNMMIKPPATPKVKPGRLPPPGQRHAPELKP